MGGGLPRENCEARRVLATGARGAGSARRASRSEGVGPVGSAEQTPDVFTVAFQTLPSGLCALLLGKKGVWLKTNVCLVARRSLQPRGSCELQQLCLPAPCGPWPPAWAGSLLWCPPRGAVPLPRPGPVPPRPLGGSGVCLPGGQLPPTPLPAAVAQLTILPRSCHLSPPGAMCHPVSRQRVGGLGAGARGEREGDPRWGREGAPALTGGSCGACHLAPGLSLPAPGMGESSCGGMLFSLSGSLHVGAVGSVWAFVYLSV